ncbi:MarR family winged helix-turn-helix transcriptional regulator [Pseudomaricurvus sp. HS19]|uniref:MarR family winged helix-turn-helix transcriptional regulator n=1 Tax=Pseudomaricurvus sp. HS19 TaxID=2692626 RepID=UPI0013715FC4|nr:MarR family transcriptional regulator [Pseudomaricurvus sp. HS19]MYM61822.1 MarR family transcriptional regulator [Pseudomaricurvus sp. HS19]
MKNTLDNKYADPLFLMVDELIRTSSRLRTVLGQSLKDVGLTKTEVTVLTAVVVAAKPPTMSQIGRSLGSPRQVIQRSANALIKQGLIKAVDNPGDLRAKLLEPTASGIELKAEIDARARKSAEGLTETLDHKRCEKITADLRKLRREIETYVRQREIDGVET